MNNKAKKSIGPIGEAIANTIIASIGESSLEQILQRSIDKSKTKGKTMLKAGKVFAEGLKQFALETNTKIDDALAEAIDRACINVAHANKIGI